MALPRFTTRQLLIYITWMCVGFGGISFSLQSWRLTRGIEHDYLAGLEPVARITAFVLGWIAASAAVVSLVFSQRRSGALIASLLLTLPFALSIAIGATSSFSSAADLGVTTPIVGGIVAIIGAIEAGRMIEKRDAKPKAGGARP